MIAVMMLLMLIPPFFFMVVAPLIRRRAMKIEFLNEELTQARVTRGWFRKVEASIVETDVTQAHGVDYEISFGGYPYTVWAFQSTKRPVDEVVSIKVSDAKVRILRDREDAVRPAEWEPVKEPTQLPAARSWHTKAGRGANVRGIRKS